jgi:hypothetical protein
MRSEQVQIGLTLRVTRNRWDVPAGTLATVESVGAKWYSCGVVLYL